MVFAMGGDPVKLGVVDSLARPGGNATGIAFLVNALTAKHLQLLQELAPAAKAIGFLVNPNDPNLPSDAKQAQDAAQLLGHRLSYRQCQRRERAGTGFRDTLEGEGGGALRSGWSLHH